MDRQTQMQRLGQSLQAAARQRDWRALQRLDDELGQALQRWRSGPALGAAEVDALAQLRGAHARARAACEAEMQSLTVTLERMREGRERWRAYAASADWLSEGEIPA